MHKIALPDWLYGPERWNKSFEDLVPKKTALLVVDLQNFFMKAESPLAIAEAREIVPNVNWLIGATRKAGGHVIFLQHTFDDNGPRPMPKWQYRDAQMRQALADGLSEGTEGHKLYSTLDVWPTDRKVRKYRPSAFVPGSSDLHEILRGMDVDTLIVTGTVTNVCCESTARDAQMLDYRVLFVADATASANDELHNAALMSLQYYFADVVGTEQAVARLEAGR